MVRRLRVTVRAGVREAQVISVAIMHLPGFADVLWLSVTAALKQLISNKERQPCV